MEPSRLGEPLCPQNRYLQVVAQEEYHHDWLLANRAERGTANVELGHRLDGRALIHSMAIWISECRRCKSLLNAK